MSRDCVVLKSKLVFVMGGGKFGTRALRYLKAKAAKVLVADVNSNCTAISEVDVQAAELCISNSLADG